MFDDFDLLSSACCNMPDLSYDAMCFGSITDNQNNQLDFCCDLLDSNITSMEWMPTENKEKAFPTEDQDIIRYLINKQTFDGLWNLDSKDINELTGKPLSHFPQSINTEVVVTSIVVVVFETRFASFSSMWHGVVQKARKRLLDLFGNDSKNLNKLLEDIRKQLDN
jgi:hypothetical protein